MRNIDIQRDLFYTRETIIFIKEIFMKKFTIYLVIGMLLLSGAVFAQTTQGANNLSSQSAQSVNPDSFAGGGYNGPVLTPIAIMDLLNAVPNQFVIVQGYLVQQRVPGTFVLADSTSNPTVSVVVRFNPYSWANLTIDPSTPVLVYGNVDRSDMRIEIEATRIEIQK